MKANMGTADRAIRIVVAIVIGILYFTGIISGPLAVILGVVAIVFLITGFAARCPAYGPLGISTCKKPDGSPGA